MRACPGWGSAAALAVLLSSGAAAAQQDTCRDAYVETQRQQRAAHFLAARRAAVTCGQDSCSETVRAHCIEWLTSIERALPTLLVDARDANGAPVAGLRIEANGEPLTEHWDGRAIELDPGEYTLRFLDGEHVVEARVLIAEAEKYRTLAVRFDAPPASRAAAAVLPVAAISPAAISPAAVPPPAEAPGLPSSAYALGGLSLAGFALFAALGSSGYVSERHLRERCAGACRPGDVDSVRTRYLIADVGLALGASAGIAAAAIWLWAPSGEQRPSTGLALGLRSIHWQGEF